MSEFWCCTAPPGEHWEITGELAYFAQISSINASCFWRELWKQSVFLFFFQVAGECSRSFPPEGINDGLCGERWYRQVLQGPPFYIHVPGSLNICHLSARTRTCTQSSPVFACLCLHVLKLFSKLNKLILAL